MSDDDDNPFRRDNTSLKTDNAQLTRVCSKESNATVNVYADGRINGFLCLLCASMRSRINSANRAALGLFGAFDLT